MSMTNVMLTFLPLQALSDKHFKSIEKIKTVNSTFMAASGLFEEVGMICYSCFRKKYSNKDKDPFHNDVECV